MSLSACRAITNSNLILSFYPPYSLLSLSPKAFCVTNFHCSGEEECVSFSYTPFHFPPFLPFCVLFSCFPFLPFSSSKFITNREREGKLVVFSTKESGTVDFLFVWLHKLNCFCILL